MDPVLIEVAKYGLAALLAAFVIYGQYKAVVALFNKYDEAQNQRIALGERVLATMTANTAATQALTTAIETLREVLKAKR